jgi:hypothetical protein
VEGEVEWVVGGVQGLDWRGLETSLGVELSEMKLRLIWKLLTTVYAIQEMGKNINYSQRLC